MWTVPSRWARLLDALERAGILALSLAVGPGASALAGQPEGQAIQEQSQSPAYVSDELLIKFESGLSAERAEQIHEELGVEVLDRTLLGGRLHLVRVPPGRSLEEVRRAYETKPGVEYAEPNALYRPQKREARSVGNAGTRTGSQDLRAEEKGNVRAKPGREGAGEPTELNADDCL